MALTQPTLYSQAAFDATQEHIFGFNVIGGDQVVANTLTIVENENNTQVYSVRQETFSLSHTLPANILTNGTYYAASLTTENANGDVSVSSNIIQFYCYTTPTFVFTNLINGTNLTTSSYNFEMSYSQTENEPLEQYSFNLYDYSSNLISTSGILYTGTSTLPFVAQYTFMGLINSNSYYIECMGKTLGGTQISTGLISFGVNYNSSSTKLNLVNNCTEGYVYISSNPVPIFGFSNPIDPTYIVDGDSIYIDMAEDGDYVLWDNGFTTSTTDWTLSIWGKDFNENQQISILKNENNDSIIIKYLERNNKCYLELTATDYANNKKYQIISNEITVSSSDNLMIWVRRVDNIYDLYLFNDESYETISGDIVSFYDAIGNREIISIVCDINPVQDLNGYDNPWPAGGGKNLFNITAQSSTVGNAQFTVNSDGTVTVNATNASNSILDIGTFTLKAGVSYALNGCPAGGDVSTYRLYFGTTPGSEYDLGNGATITRETDTTLTLRIGISGTYSNLLFKPMVRLSSVSDATFAPYSNVCPITGHQGVNVYGTGVNVWDEEWENGVYSGADGTPFANPNRIRSKNAIPVVPSTTYYFNAPSSYGNINVHYYDVNGVYISTDNAVRNLVFTTPSNCGFIQWNNTTNDVTTYNNDISINYPSTDHDYHAYVGTTLPISFSSAGTVYAGYCSIDKDGNVTLTGTHAGKVFDGAEANFTKSSTFKGSFYRYWRDFEPKGKDNSTFICSHAVYHALNSQYSYGMCGSDTSCSLFLMQDPEASVNDFKTYLAGQYSNGTPVTIVYELATPVTYTLSSVTVPSTVQGENNWWCDTGSITITHKQ